MKLKRIILLVLAFVLVGTASAFADEAVEMYKGSKVKVVVNGETLDVPGILLTVDGKSKTMLPSRDVADKLQAMVYWDDATRTVYISKPNVHITLTQPLKDNVIGMFAQVYYKNHYDFVVFTQMDNLPKNIRAVKFEITDPYGQVVTEGEHIFESYPGKMYWLPFKASMKFDYVGTYKVKVYMKSDAEDRYFLVSEKLLESTQK
jgi:hypothetical protein